ncbi:hypothetical protein GCM10027299_02660 [Larkinella ripae]
MPSYPDAGGFPDSKTGANAPLDGGVSILLLAGAAAGIKKAYQKRKEAANKETQN